MGNKQPNQKSNQKNNDTSITIKNKEYKIIRELGRDTFGRVVQVLSKSNKKHYAIKIIQINEVTKETIQSYEKEAYILSKFNSNNIVKYYDSSKDNNNIYILMEFCNGDNLRNFIDKHIDDNTLIEEDKLKIIIKQICKGIKEIHDKKVIHRDLKPENIFINENMNIKIGDFGISHQLNSKNTHTLTKYGAGTDCYKAPEILKNGIYNEKSDIWSLGCIIYELFNLSIYFNDKFSEEIKIIDTDIYNNRWQKLIDSLLQIDYKKRFDIDQVNQFLENELNNNHKNNIIIGEIYIKKEDVGKDIQIINSLEGFKRTYKFKDGDDDWKNENEKEIKENIEIKIDGKIIEFTYKYKFNKEGKYKIEYSFKNNLTKTLFMFCDCKSLINLDLSNFNTQNVTNMWGMFWCCSSLTNLNLSNCNTKNVTNMCAMFWGCNSLINLDLSNFNTQNVTNMGNMFAFCHSLKKENVITKDNRILNNFHTKLII